MKLQRTCIGCKSKKDKFEMMRICLPKDGQVQIDFSGKSNGRGAYLCSLKCFEKSLNKGYLQAALRSKISKEDLGNLQIAIQHTIEHNYCVQSDKE